MTFAESTRRLERLTLRTCALVGAGAFLALMAPTLVGSFYFGLDLTRIDLGLMCAIQQHLEANESLLLSSYLGNGGPLFARPSARLLYPPQHLALLFSPDLGVSLFACLHVALGAATTTYLVRTHGFRPGTSAAAGVAFACTGTVLDLILHGTFVVAAAWLPLAWAAARRAVHPRGRSTHLALLATALAGLLLGGEPQAFLIGSCLALAELARVAVARRRLPWRAGLQLGAVIVGAFALALPMWGQTLAEMELGRRGGVLASAESFRWPFGPATWLAAVWPGILDEPVRPLTHYWGVWHGDSTLALPWNRQPYVGPLFLVAVVSGLGLARARAAALLFVVGLLFSLGSTLPLLPALTDLVPVLGWFRYPAKYLVVTTLAGVVVAAVSTVRLEHDARHRRRFQVAGAAFLVAQGLAITAVGLGSSSLDLVAADIPGPPQQLDLPTLSSVLWQAAWQATVPLAIAWALVCWWPASRRFVLGLVVCDLLLAAPSSLSVGPALSDLQTPVAQLPAERTVLCVEPTLYGRGLHSTEGEISDWGNLAGLRSVLPPELHACDGLRAAITYGPLQSTVNERLEAELGESRADAARALGCTHVLVPQPAARAGTRPVAPTPELARYQRLLRVQLREIVDPIPEVFVVPSPRFHPSVNTAWRAVRDGTTATALLSIVDDPLGRLSRTELPAGDDVHARVEWRDTIRATLHVDGTGPAVVGVRTAYLAGWRAEQGGRPLPVVRLGGQHLGVVLESAETGPVELRYHPPRQALNLAAAALGLVAILAVCLWRRHSTRSQLHS